MNRDKITVIYGKDAYKMGIELLEKSGAAALFGPGVSVGVKPNLVVPKPSASGATTHAGFAEAVFALARDAGVTDLRIIEGAWIGAGTGQGFKAEGYDQLALRYNAKLIDTKKDKAVEKSFAGRKGLVCESALDVDLLINLPVLKAHCQTRLTCAIKNLKGCIPDSEKRRYHADGLFRPISLLPGLIPTAFTLVDGICGDLTFEEGGTPIPMHRAFIGVDPVKLDAYAASLLGLSLSDVPYIGMAERHGLGTAAFTEEDIVRLNEPGDAQDPADMAGFGKVKRLTRNVREDSACSACYGSLVHALNILEEQRISCAKPIHIGQGYKGKSGDGVGIGRCCAGFSPCAPGCPPTAERILETLTGTP